MIEAGPTLVAERAEPDGFRRGHERELLLRYRSGDRDAFAELVDAYRAPVYAFLCRSGVPSGDREDLFQDVFIKIHLNADRFEAGRPLHPWIFTIVVNTTRSYFRRRDRRTVSIDQLPIDAVPAGTPSADRSLGARQTLERLEQQLLELPPRHREALLLAVVENMPLADIADVLSAPVNTVKTWLRRARSQLLANNSEATT